MIGRFGGRGGGSEVYYQMKEDGKTCQDTKNEYYPQFIINYENLSLQILFLVWLWASAQCSDSEPST